MQEFPFSLLFTWFQKQKRALPWRENKTSYSVWVAEVMLQQTKALVVIPYFMAWMEAFPSVEALSKASIEEVIKRWEGLGYYQRARNLHKGAKQIVEEFSGAFPNTKEELLKIRGIGPYTASAILAFAYGKNSVPIDGNVKRVFSRYFCIEEDITSAKAEKELSLLANFMEKTSPHPLGEAFIELGALVCGKKPHCFACPLKKTCQAFANNMQHVLPRKKKKIVYEELRRVVFLLEYENKILVRKNLEGIMQDLFEFPYVSKKEELLEIEKKGRVVVRKRKKLAEVRHTFTRFRVRLEPWHLLLEEKPELLGYEMWEKKKLLSLPFSSGHRRILEGFLV